MIARLDQVVAALPVVGAVFDTGDHAGTGQTGGGAAFRSGRFIRTAKQTFMLPAESLAVREQFDGAGRAIGTHPPGVWFPEVTEEISVRSNRYDLTSRCCILRRNTGTSRAPSPN